MIKMIIDGPNGSGKSVTLMQIYAFFKESIKMDEKKLCLYAPNVHKWTTGYFAYYPQDSAAEFAQPELAWKFFVYWRFVIKGKEAVEGLEKKLVKLNWMPLTVPFHCIKGHLINWAKGELRLQCSWTVLMDWLMKIHWLLI